MSHRDSHSLTALRLRNKRWYASFFLLGSIAVVAAWHWFGGDRPELLLSGMGAVGGLFYFFYRQHLDETKLFKELFFEFNERYGQLSDDLNRILFGPSDGDCSETERQVLFGYFNLCAEEYFFYRAGYIDSDVWQSWRRGMSVYFRHPRIRQLWVSDCRADSYYGFQPD
jgi:hypothetical protein